MKPFPEAPEAGAAPGGRPAGVLLRLQGTGTGSVGPHSALPPAAVMSLTLDGAELARAARTADPGAAATFLAGRYLLRVLVAEMLGVEVRRLTSSFTCPRCGTGSDHGRPGYALGGERLPVALSLSRAGQDVLLGALDLHGSGTGSGIGTAIGVDLELVKDVGFDGFDDVALTREERSALERLPGGHRPVERARLWSRKESLVKALGTGFTDRDPDEVAALGDDRITDVTEVDGVLLETVGLVAAVAVVPAATG